MRGGGDPHRTPSRSAAHQDQKRDGGGRGSNYRNLERVERKVGDDARIRSGMTQEQGRRRSGRRSVGGLPRRRSVWGECRSTTLARGESAPVEGAAGEETRLQRSSGGRGRQRRGTRVGQRLGRRGNERKGGKVIADGDGPSGGGRLRALHLQSQNPGVAQNHWNAIQFCMYSA